MGNFGKRIGLVHKLRQLARAEEFTNSRSRRFRIDQVLRHDRVDFNGRHTFLDGALHTKQANAVLVFHQLANGTYTTVTKVVDVVHAAFAITKISQRFNNSNNVVATQDTQCIRRIKIKTHVHFHTTNGRKVVAVVVEEHAFEHCSRRFNGRWLARTHHTIDIHERGVAVHVFINRHSVADVPANIDVIDIQCWNICHTIVEQCHKCTGNFFSFRVNVPCQLVTGFDPDLASFFVDDVFRGKTANDLIEWNEDVFNFALVLQFLDCTRCNFLASFGNHFTGLRVNNVEKRLGTLDAFREERCGPAFFLFVLLEVYGVVIRIANAFLIQTQCIKQRGYRKFAATVDPCVNDVFGVELEVQPAAAVRDDPRSKQQFTRRVGFTLVVVKEHTRRAVHLGNDNTLGAVNHKCAVRCHKGHFAHEHVLLFNIFNGTRARIFVHIKHDQTESNLQRGAICHVALHALFYVVLRWL